MQTLRTTVQRKARLIAGSLAATLLFSATLLAQTPQPRITAEIDSSQRAIILGTHSPKARPELDAGRVPAATKLQGITMVFSRSAAQESDLQALIAAQQDQASPQYHQWLTPNQFAARFGVADADIAKVQFWLQQQGFSIDGTSQGKTRLSFSGSVEQVETAFATEMHYYNVGGVKHFAPSTDLSVPTALSSMVQAVANLSTFRPKPHVRVASPQRAPNPNFTSSQSGGHFLTPKDIATIYNINPAYKAGLTGSGQSIAIVGQSSITVADIENFQAAAGLAKKDPTLVLVPNSGTAAVSAGDEMESDIDLEYSGGTAPGATIFFVFVGNSRNFNVFNALAYAIDQKTAPVISISYGDCESDLSAGEYASLNGVLAQAAAQGQSIATADGDDGSTDCSGNKDQTTAAQEALAVDFPSSSQYVTAMGGTEFPAADVASTNTTFWESASGSDVTSSALSYIPEMVWNDDFAPMGSTPGGLSSGGGGASTLTSRPSWQTGVPGIPSGNFRLLPDIALTASPNNAGFLYCSSDTSSSVTGSCTPGNGFRDASDTFLTVAGGTSFDAPIFAGMLAIINQKLNSTGQGVANTTLYKLAGNATTYASAFHDITSGTNECTAGASLCSAAGESEFSAGAGYDEASGLGSVDFSNLLAAWANGTGGTPQKSFTMAATNATVADGDSVTSSITVTPQNGFTGTIAFAVSPAIANACYVLPNLTVSSASAVTATLTIFTSSSACASAAAIGVPGQRSVMAATQGDLWPVAASLTATPNRVSASVVFAAFLLLGLLSFRSRRLAAFSAVFLLTAVGLVLSGCSNSNSSSTPSTPTSSAAKGTYTLSIVGTDTASAAITASTSTTLTID